MAATIFGFSPNEIKPQPGLQISRSESGGWSATHEVIVKAEDFANLIPNFAKGTLLSIVDPDIPAPFDEFLTIDTVSFTRTEGDLYVFNITCTGGTRQFDFDEDELTPAALPTYVLTGQLQDVPFSMHPKWGELESADQTLLGMLLNGLLTYSLQDQILYKTDTGDSQVAYIEQLSDADARNFAYLIQQGQSTYQRSSYTWTEETEGTAKLTEVEIGKIGQIAIPRGDPPEATDNRNWMLTNVSQSQSGTLYRTTLEWTISEPGGYDDFLYEEAAPEPPP
jgi:hypothetical protein